MFLTTTPSSGDEYVLHCDSEIGASMASTLDCPSYWKQRIPWYPDGCFGPYRVKDGYSRRELVADGMVHAIGIVAGIGAIVAMILNISVYRPPWQVTISLAVYCCSLLAMLCSSAVFNGLAWSNHIVALQLADHTGILFLISGTYTPFMTMACNNRTLCFVWFLALVSFIAKASRSRIDHVALHVPIFLLMGWCVTLVWSSVTRVFSPWALQCVLCGGVFYTCGLMPWAVNKLEFHNAIWHLFVLGGCAFFYIIMYYEVSQPAQWQGVPQDTCEGVLF
jgi:hemolysin III